MSAHLQVHCELRSFLLLIYFINENIIQAFQQKLWRNFTKFVRAPNGDIKKHVYSWNLYLEITDDLTHFIVWPCEKLFKLQRTW